MQRRAIIVRGTVQGVGFRPFVYAIAIRRGLAGFVRNDGGSVRIEVEGEPRQLDEFVSELSDNQPPLARIEEVSWKPVDLVGEGVFRIEESRADKAGPVVISPDVATCDACLAELFDPADRRYRYPFLNCTNCGPRLTIVTGAPYDRQRTTMAGFAMCAACRAEFQNPLDRRFHAQPIACPLCGPRLTLADARGIEQRSADPLAELIAELRDGRIGAMKGLGGYHLVCDASNDAAVRELRKRKRREEKPFAVMVADVAAAKKLCDLSPVEQSLLESNRRPIVLLNRRQESDLSEAIAPGNPQLGVMLPYTPLHHLLMRAMDGQALVMTSGNRGDEPIAFCEPEVFDRLAGIADVYLTHDRPIHVRCDDSVTRVIGLATDGRESPMRRSRGYAPSAIRLPIAAALPGLAVGAQLKATFGLLDGDRATLSHHLGDLDHFEAFRAFERDIDLYQRTFNVLPKWIAHDLHPDYVSTHYAIRRAAAEQLRTVAVQHHHAHMASCMAEHGVTESVIGVCFDGTGYGVDGAVWGGEFLMGNYASFDRAAHLRYVPMPGADAAVREPWRMALAHLLDAGVDVPSWRARVEAAVSTAALPAAERMIERRFNSPLTSSAGRLFDAVASLIGVRDRVSFEGQAAMQLEWLASGTAEDGAYPFELCDAPALTPAPALTVAPAPTPAPAPAPARPLSIDTRPMIRAIAIDVNAGIPPAMIARRFHSTMAAIILAGVVFLGEKYALKLVAISGGVFMNRLLCAEVENKLRAKRIYPLLHRMVPTNDGGISLGQLAVASSQLVSTSPS